MKELDENWSVLENETPEEYINRVGLWEGSNVYAIKQVESHYGYDRRQSVELFFNSRPIWERFFLNHAKGVFERGGSRDGALRFIKRKTDELRNRDTFFLIKKLKPS